MVDNKFAQTPQVVRQAFSNIAKPGYRSGPPATVQQKDVVKLEYMSHENISIGNFLSTFGMASESCLNNLRLSRDQRERLFDQFRATSDGPTREQIMQQLFSMTQQEASQMQFMLDISRSMSKAYTDLVSNSTLTNLVLVSRDAYLRHAINVDTLNKRYSVNLCQHPSTWCNSPSFPSHRVVAEEDVAAAEDAAVEATHQAQSSNNLLNDTQQSVLPPPQPGIRPKTLSESHWDYPQGCAQLNGNKSLSASTLQERVKTPLEASHRPQLSKQIPGHTQIQDGNPIYTSLPQERRMGYIHRSDRRLPTCPYSYPVTKVPQVLPQRHHLPIYQPPVRPSHGPIGVHKPCERSQAYSPTTGNQTTPIFGRLVDSSSFQTDLHRTNTKTTKTGERPRICSKPQEVRTHTLSEVRLPRIPFFARHGSCEAHARQVNKASGDVPSPLSEVCYQCKDSKRL